jgi:hypothetical protein
MNRARIFSMFPILAFLLAGLFFSCTKEQDPVPEKTDPLIELSASLDGQSLNWEIGRNGWEMLPLFGSDSNGNTVYTCQVLNRNRLDVGTLEIRIQRPANSILPVTDPAAVFAPGLRSFFEEASLNNPVYGWYFEVDRPHKTGMTYKWTIRETLFGGTSTTTISGGEEMRSLKYDFSEPGNFPVQLTAFQPNGQDSAVYSDTVAVGPGRCHLDFSYELLPGTQTFRLKMISKIQDPPVALWIANQTDIQSVSAQLNFPFFDNDIQKMLLFVNSPSCGEQTQFKLISADPDANITSFHSYDSTRTSAESQVVIRYTHPDGRVFTSQSVRQPFDSFFQIESAGPYTEENLYTTQVKLKALLSDGTENKTLDIPGARLVFKYR